MKRALLVVVVALMVVCAGCAGGTTDALGSDDADSEETLTSDRTDADRDDESTDPVDDPDAIGESIEVTDRQVERVSPDAEYVTLTNTGEAAVDSRGSNFVIAKAGRSMAASDHLCSHRTSSWNRVVQ
ncbi:hypothetical protein [Natronosalvus vescus]|uniref:hypothetical protein n=1 Tax=Natronosalvus vescus TaxID=2953881 RepID=UPI00209128A5|nr:hypothetical protein [Natronosalvus vescus]